MYKKACVVSLVLLSLAVSAPAGNTLWDNSNEDQHWHEPLNWQFDAVPDATTACFIWPDFSFLEAHPIISEAGAVCDILLLQGTGFPDHDNINVELAGGTLTVRDAYMNPPAGDGGNPKYTATLHVKAGTLDITGWLLANTPGDDIVEMTGGTFNIYNMSYSATTGLSQINLRDGTINILNSMVLGSGCNFDITEGTLTMKGPWHLEHIPDWIADSRMTGYGGWGKLSYPYDSGTDTVTVTCDCINPSPADEERNVDVDTTLEWNIIPNDPNSWQHTYEVYLSKTVDFPPATSFAVPGVAEGTIRVTGVVIPGGSLDNDDYSWQVNTITPGGTITGDIWQFSTALGRNMLWDNSSTDQNWHNSLNWQFDTVPTENDTCFISTILAASGVHPIISEPDAVCYAFLLDGSDVGQAAVMELDGGTLTAYDGYLQPSADVTAELYIKSGTLNVINYFFARPNGNTLVDMNCGTFNVGNLVYDVTSNSSQLNIHGGARVNVSNSMYLGAGSNVDITTGTLTLNGDWTGVVGSWMADDRMTAYGGQGALRYDYNVTNTGKTTVTAVDWQRPEVNLLSGFDNMYNPHIIEEPGEAYPYRMYFFGWANDVCNTGYSGCDAIFLARSDDLLDWQVYKGSGQWDATMTPSLWVPVLTADDKYYDEWHNGDPSVIKRDGTYYMAYSTTGSDVDGIPNGDPCDADGDIACIMGATSSDGINWTRSSAPILIYTPEIGQMEDCDDPYYCGLFHRPSLMWDNDHWRMWFDYWQPGEFFGLGMGHAECFGDPMVASNWTMTHAMNNSPIANWPNPDVVKVGQRYYSYGDPVGYPGGQGWTSRQIREAVSDDGLNWDVLGFITPDSDTPANHVPEAVVLSVDGYTWLYVFYSCQIGGDPYDWQYDRIRSMRTLITPMADLDGDDDVDLMDYALFVSCWLDTDCCESASNWCSGTDMDYSGKVDFEDLSIFAESWLYGQ